MSYGKAIDDALEHSRHCGRLLAAYDLVLEDLSDWDTDEWKFVRVRIEWMRADIAEEIERVTMDVSIMRSQCSHAFERIGEAKPPFRHCVKCGQTEAE